MTHTKKCSTCKIEKTVDRFYVCRTSSSGYQGSCKACENKRGKWRAARRGEEVAKRGGCCEQCGVEGEDSFFDFHHINPDEKEIPINKVWRMAEHKREAELAKCIMVCPNCHRKLHMAMGEYGINNATKRFREELKNDSLKYQTPE